jgi:hypothetical protein
MDESSKSSYIDIPWPQRPWQPLMRTIDVVDLDVEDMVRTAAQNGIDCLVVNAAGFTAWYPTRLPSQRPNPFMTDDFLGNVISAAAKYNLQVYGRVDISKGFLDWYQAHPDWYVVDGQGRPVRYWDLYETCFTGPYVQTHNFQIIDELLSIYPLDGLFYNFYYLPRCHCDRCQRIVQQETGQPVPDGSQLDPVYERWRHQTLATYTARLRNRIRHHRPQARLIAYHHTQKGWDPRLMADTVDIWGAQISSPLLSNPLDPQPKWLYWPGEEAHKGYALKPGVPPLLWLSYSEMFSSRRVLQPADRLVVHMSQAIAHGAGVCPGLNGVSTRQDDARPLTAVAAKQRQLAEIRQFLIGTTSAARIALVYSPESFWFGPDGGQPVGAAYGHLAEFRGLYAALVDSRFPLDVQMSGRLEASILTQYQVIILPAVHCLLEPDIDILTEWVREGGRLVMTADSGVMDAQGRPRESPPIPLMESLPNPVQQATGAYLAVSDDTLRAALDGTRLISLAQDFWPLETDRGQTDLSLIGPFRNNAPEFTFWEEGQTGPPGLVRRPMGQGEIIQLPWRIGALYYHLAIPDYLKLVAWLMERAVGPPPVISTAPISVEIVYREQWTERGKRWLIHLVNNTAAAERPLLSHVPLGQIIVKVGCAANRGYLAIANREVSVTRDGEWSVIRLSQLHQHELIVLTAG